MFFERNNNIKKGHKFVKKKTCLYGDHFKKSNDHHNLGVLDGYRWYYFDITSEFRAVATPQISISLMAIAPHCLFP